MVKFASTVAISALSLPLLASALPYPIVSRKSRGLTIDVRELDGQGDLDSRGFWKKVKDTTKTVGHDIKEVATSPVGQMAAKAAMTLMLRDPELYQKFKPRTITEHPLKPVITKRVFEGFDARGIVQNVEKGVKDVGQAVATVANSPFGQIVTKGAVDLLKDALHARDAQFDNFEARGFVDGVKEVGQKIKNFANSPIGKIAQTAGATVLEGALFARDIEVNDLNARDFDMEERYFDDELHGMYGRNFDIDELD